MALFLSVSQLSIKRKKNNFEQNFLLPGRSPERHKPKISPWRQDGLTIDTLIAINKHRICQPPRIMTCGCLRKVGWHGDRLMYIKPASAVFHTVDAPHDG